MDAYIKINQCKYIQSRRKPIRTDGQINTNKPKVIVVVVAPEDSMTVSEANLTNIATNLPQATNRIKT